MSFHFILIPLFSKHCLVNKYILGFNQDFKTITISYRKTNQYKINRLINFELIEKIKRISSFYIKMIENQAVKELLEK